MNMHADRAPALALLWTLAGFKLFMSIMILWTFPSWHAVAIVMVLSIPWVLLFLGWMGVLARMRARLHQARARRAELLAQEWYLD